MCPYIEEMQERGQIPHPHYTRLPRLCKASVRYDSRFYGNIHTEWGWNRDLAKTPCEQTRAYLLASWIRRWKYNFDLHTRWTTSKNGHENEDLWPCHYSSKATKEKELKVSSGHRRHRASGTILLVDLAARGKRSSRSLPLDTWYGVVVFHSE